MSAGKMSSRVPCKGEERPTPSPWQVRLRLFATVVNSAMVVYVYGAHLAGLEWSDFGRYRALEMGQSRSIRDYLTAWEPAFDHLRVFTFSEAILENLVVYTIIGIPVAMALLVVEWKRVRWLQSLVSKSLAQEMALRSNRLLEGYLWMFCATLVCIVLVGPLHLDMPRAHYACAASAITCAVNSMILYLVATAELTATAASVTTSDDMIAWATQQRWIRPVLKAILVLHAVAFAAAAWKAESLGDDLPALIFGIVETMLVLAYQAWPLVLGLDDMAALRGKGMAAQPEQGLEETKFERMLAS